MSHAGSDGSERGRFDEFIEDAEFLDEESYAFYSRGVPIRTIGSLQRRLRVLAECLGLISLVAGLWVLLILE